ncbi:hypothetical protein AAHC03_05434 [Spirometra sp. Aus1]
MASTDPSYAPFFGIMGATASIVFSFGAAYGTAKSGAGICSMGVMRPELIMKSIVPVVMAGIVAIYGLVVSVVISQQKDKSTQMATWRVKCRTLRFGSWLCNWHRW